MILYFLWRYLNTDTLGRKIYIHVVVIFSQFCVPTQTLTYGIEEDNVPLLRSRFVCKLKQTFSKSHYQMFVVVRVKAIFVYLFDIFQIHVPRLQVGRLKCECDLTYADVVFLKSGHSLSILKVHTFVLCDVRLLIPIIINQSRLDTFQKLKGSSH